MKRSLRPAFLLPLAGLSLLVAACGGADPTATPAPTATPRPTTAPQATTAPQPTATRAPAQGTPTAAPQPTATRAAQATATRPAPPQATPTPIVTRAPAATAVPLPDRELRIALALVDFILLPEQSGHRRWQDPLYDYIVGGNPDGNLEKDSGVVSSWEVSADARTWTFNMRKGVTFHNGVGATSKDFKWTLDYHARQGSITVGSDYLRANATSTAPDPSKVVVSLKSPNFGFAKEYLSPLGSGATFYLIPKDYMDSIGNEAFNRAPVGTGPYKFKSTQLGFALTFEGVDNHWYYGRPKFKTLKIFQVQEEPTRVALIRSGQSDVVELGRARSAEMKKAGFNIFLKEGSGIASVYLHEQYKSYGGVPNPLGNIKVREALNLAVDRQTIVDTYLLGLATPTINFPVVSWDAAYQKLPLPKFDPARARQLLTEAGYPRGFELDFYIFPFRGLEEGPEVMEGVAVWWEQIGLKVNRKPTDFNAYRQPWFTQGFTKPSAGGPLFIANRTIATALSGAANKVQGTRIAEDPELEALDAQWKAAANDAEYVRIGRLVQQKWMEKWMYVTLFEAGETFAADPKAVTAWNMGKFAHSLRINSIAAGK